MYGLPSSGISDNNQLLDIMVKEGYCELPRTPGLCKHYSCNISFTQVVDFFGIKYQSKNNTKNIIHALQKYYKLEVDWICGLYCGIKM